VLRHGIPLSMDGTGCWRDNIFIERLWRTLKYEEVYLPAYDSVSAAHRDQSIPHALQRPPASLEPYGPNPRRCLLFLAATRRASRRAGSLKKSSWNHFAVSRFHNKPPLRVFLQR
jgi:transposase InsO family protein